VGAFRIEANAGQLHRRLRAKGYAPYIFSTHGKNHKKWFAVRIGDFTTLKDARRAARDYRNREKTNAAVTYKDSLNSAGL